MSPAESPICGYRKTIHFRDGFAGRLGIKGFEVFVIRFVKCYEPGLFLN